MTQHGTLTVYYSSFLVSKGSATLSAEMCCHHDGIRRHGNSHCPPSSVSAAAAPPNDF